MSEIKKGNFEHDDVFRSAKEDVDIKSNTKLNDNRLILRSIPIIENNKEINRDFVDFSDDVYNFFNSDYNVGATVAPEFIAKLYDLKKLSENLTLPWSTINNLFISKIEDFKKVGCEDFLESFEQNTNFIKNFIQNWEELKKENINWKFSGLIVNMIIDPSLIEFYNKEVLNYNLNKSWFDLNNHNELWINDIKDFALSLWIWSKKINRNIIWWLVNDVEKIDNNYGIKYNKMYEALKDKRYAEWWYKKYIDSWKDKKFSFSVWNLYESEQKIKSKELTKVINKYYNILKNIIVLDYSKV